MNILIVTHHFLYGSGGGIFASRAYANAFSMLYNNVTLLYPIKGNNICQDINSRIICKPIAYDIPKWRKFIHLLTGKTHRYYNIFEKELQSKQYDLVVFDNSKVSYRLINIAHKYKAKVITIHHNYEYEYNRDNSRGLLQKLSLYWTKQYEKEAVVKSDLNLTLTQQDKNLLLTHYGNTQSKISVIGCFEYSNQNNFQPSLQDIDESKFIITGNLSSKQTEDSLIPWIKEYYSTIKDIFPNGELIIAGKAPSSSLMQLAKEHQITIIPSPKSMKPILENSKYYICATSLGGGLKLRIMDGLKHGLPVICHEVSARGYDEFIKHGYILTYNTPISFKKALITLKNTKYKKDQIIQLYQSLFSFENGVNRLNNILKEI